MSRIGEILGKLVRNREGSTNNYPKITPDEMELRSFKERERLDNVRVELAKYRKKNSMFNNAGGIDIYKKSPSILKGDSLIRKQKKILNSGGMFW